MTARRKLVLRAGILALLAVAMTGCSTEEFLRFGWPEGITDEAVRMRELWTGSVIAALVVGVIVWGLIFWTVAFHRKKNDEIPRQFKENLPLEIIYTVIPVILVLVLFYYTVVVQNVVTDKSAEPDVTVAVNAFKWNWEFEYADTSDESGDVVSTVGSSTEVPILVLPVDQVIRFEVYSTDVIHSFWVPEFLFKLDVIPGNENGRDNVFQVTVREEGSYVGRCAELCGSYHAYMNFEVRGVSQEDYESYVDARESGMTTAEALEDIGQDPESSTTRPMDTDREQAAGTGD
ncbi:MAG: cytochrome c oxidase subunit II [Actinomycetota bacterium]|nr:cytochrome c oxidase subunit II [Actinomycetota bacterium]